VDHGLKNGAATGKDLKALSLFEVFSFESFSWVLLTIVVGKVSAVLAIWDAIFTRFCDVFKSLFVKFTTEWMALLLWYTLFRSTADAKEVLPAVDVLCRATAIPTGILLPEVVGNLTLFLLFAKLDKSTVPADMLELFPTSSLIDPSGDVTVSVLVSTVVVVLRNIGVLV